MSAAHVLVRSSIHLFGLLKISCNELGSAIELACALSSSTRDTTGKLLFFLGSWFARPNVLAIDAHDCSATIGIES